MDKREDLQSKLSGKGEQERSFFVATFSMLAKLARSDGFVSRHEIDVIEGFIEEELQLDKSDRELAIQIFREAQDSQESLLDFAEQFVDAFGEDRELRLSLLELLYSVAAADGTPNLPEEKMMRDACQFFGFGDKEHSRLCGSRIDDPRKYYSILHCSQDDSDETIKLKYKRLLFDFHPDRLLSKGLPEAFLQFANQKLQEINMAYEEIKRIRNFSS